MSSLDPLYQGVLYNTVNASQQEINTLLKQLQTGLKINSAGDDPANIYVSDTLNFEALENAATETNAQNGLTYLQVAQKAYGDIITELNKIKDLANNALTGNYSSVQIADFQNQITASINTIKNIESGTTFNGIQVFNNSNSVGLVNEHMFAVTSKQDAIVTTATIVTNRGQDYSEYLTDDVNRYNKIDIGGSIALINDDGTVISSDAIHIASQAQFLAIVSGMTLGIGLDKNYILDTNINLAAYNTNGKALFQGDFVGTFDGNGYTISNLTINNVEASVDADKTYFVYDSTKDKQGVGLFDTVLGAVSNLNLSNVNISVAGNLYRAGALAGIAADGAIISNVNVVSATITGGTDSKCLGGLVGVADNATISDSASNATVTGAWSLGGLVGEALTSTIKNSSSSGAVNCNKATTQVDYYYVGSGTDRMAGGLVGYAGASTIDSSYSSATVTNSYYYAGGLAGMIGSSKVSNSYATGNVTAGATVGGFSGDIRGNSSVSNCYAQNSVSGALNVGGFYGSNGQAGVNVGSISNCFYDSTRYAGGFGPAADAAQWTNDSGLSTAVISGHAAAFGTITASWDNIDVWNLSGASPTLRQVGTHAPVSVSSANLVTIETAQQFVNALGGTTAGKTFILLDNIDMSSLGPQTNSLINNTFQGTLLGNGYAITNLQINSTENNVGLFDTIGATGKVQDLILSDFVIKGNHWVGSLAGMNNGGTIDNVAVVNTSVKTTQAEAGGLVGWNGNSGSITDSYATGSVSGDSLSADLGGLVGNNDNSGTITKSFANVDVTGGSFIGGLVGIQGATASITQSYARGSVIGQEHVGGLVGVNNGTITNTYSLGDVTGQSDTAGLVGGNNGTVTNSYSLSEVKDSTTNYDVTLFQMTATGETVQGIDQRPNDEFSITYTAPGGGGHYAAAGTYAFRSEEDFLKFQTFDTTGSASGDIGIFYQKAAGNTWNGRKLQAANRYQYTESPLTDPTVIGVPIDADGVDYSVVKSVTGAQAGVYAFKSVDDYNKFQAYSTNAATSTSGVDKFYKLDAPNDRWYVQSLTITPDAVTYSIQAGDGGAVLNMPSSTEGTFNVLWTDGAGTRGAAGTVYAFSSEEDKNSFMGNNGAIALYYSENANGTWHAWKQNAVPGSYTYNAVDISGAVVADDPMDIQSHYTYLKTVGSYTIAFASQEDADHYVDNSTFTGEIAKYYYKLTADGAAAPWNAAKITKTPGYVEYRVDPAGLPSLDSAPADPNGVNYNIEVGSYYRFATQQDADNFNNGAFLGAISTFYQYNTATDAWDAMSVKLTPTSYNASAPIPMADTAGSIPVGENGVIYDTFRNLWNNDKGATLTYAFASQEDADNYQNNTGFVKDYYVDWQDGSANPWKHLTTTATLVPGVGGDTDTGVSVLNIPDVVDIDGQYYSYVQAFDDGPGYHKVYAFKSEADYDTWRSRNTSGFGNFEGTNQITYFQREYDPSWMAVSDWEKHISSFEDSGNNIDIYDAGFSSEIDLTPAGDPNYDVIANVWGSNSAFASANDRDLCIAGTPYDGLTEYDYNSVTNTWTKCVYTSTTGYTVNTSTGSYVSATPADPSFDFFRISDAGVLMAFANADDASKVLDAGNGYDGLRYYAYTGNGSWDERQITVGHGVTTNMPLVGIDLAPADTSYNFIPGDGKAWQSAQNEDDWLKYAGNSHYYYEGNGNWAKWVVGDDLLWNKDPNLIGSAPRLEPDYTTTYQDASGDIYYFKDGLDRDAYIQYELTGNSYDPNISFEYYKVAGSNYATYGAHVQVYKGTFQTYSTYNANTVGSIDSTPAYQPEYRADFNTTYNDGTNTYYFANSQDKDAYIDWAADGVLTDPAATNDFKYYEFVDSANNPQFLTHDFNVQSFQSGGWKTSDNTTPSAPLNQPEYNTRYTASATRGGITAGEVFYFANEMDKSTFDNYLINGTISSNADNDFVFYKEVVSGTKARRFQFSISDYGYDYQDIRDAANDTASDRPSDINYKYQGQNGWWFASEADAHAYQNLPEYSVDFYQTNGNGFSELFTQTRTKDTYTYTRDVDDGWEYLRPTDPQAPSDMYYRYFSTDANGAGLYYFKSANDLNTFQDYVNGATTPFDIKYWFISQADLTANNRTWQLFDLQKTNPLTMSSRGTSAASKPLSTDYNVYDSSTGYWFSTESDKQAFASYVAGTTDGTFSDIYFCAKNGGGAADDNPDNNNDWDVYKLSSTIHPDTYGAIGLGGGAQYGSPNVQGYEVTWGGSYAFQNESDRDNWAKFVNPGVYGALTNAVDFTYYQKTDVNSWKLTRLSTDISPTTYTTSNLGTDVGGRPIKEGYDWVSGNQAFLNAADLALYGGGSPTGKIDLYYQYNAGTRNWDALKTVQNAQTYTRAYTPSGTYVMGRPDNEDFANIYNYGGTYYAFKSQADLNNFLNDVTESAPGVNKYASIDRYYKFDGTNSDTWQDYKMDETITKAYSISANATPLDGLVGLDYRPNVTDGYSYLYTSVGTSGRVAAGGVYAFQSQADMQNFQKYDLGTVGVTSISNYYKRNDPATLPESITGEPVLDWIGQRLEYDNNVGYFVGKNSGTLTNDFYGTGLASSNYLGDDNVTMLGDAQISAKNVAPMTGWDSTNIWDFTTSRPTLRNTKEEGSEEISPTNLNTLKDETKYVFETYDSYVTNDIRLNTALSSSGTFTVATPASAPTGVDAGRRANVATLTLAGLAGNYISNITVADNADLNTRFSEGKDFILYTNDNGATWKMDLMSSAIYGKTLSISYKGVLTSAINQGTSGFNIYLGDNKNLNVKDMSLDLAGRLNFNLTRLDGSKGTLDALNETLEYMKIKKTQLDGEIGIAQNALSNKTNQKGTMTTATGNIRNVDEAKAKAELAKRQLTQEKTDKIIEKFYNLQLTAMQNLLRINTGGNVSSIGNVYQGLTGVNSLYSQSLIDYNYKTMYDLLNGD